MNLCYTLLVISMVDCGEFHQGFRSEKIGRLIVVDIHNTLFVILMVNCVEISQHFLSGFDG